MKIIDCCKFDSDWGSALAIKCIIFCGYELVKTRNRCERICVNRWASFRSGKIVKLLSYSHYVTKHKQHWISRKSRALHYQHAVFHRKYNYKWKHSVCLRPYYNILCMKLFHFSPTMCFQITTIFINKLFTKFKGWN